MRYRQAKYGQEIDSCEREIARLEEVVKRHPQRAKDLQQARVILDRLSRQMKALGKRRSSGFYGLQDQVA